MNGAKIFNTQIYDKAVEILKANGKEIFEDDGYKVLDRSETLNILKAAM